MNQYNTTVLHNTTELHFLHCISLLLDGGLGLCVCGVREDWPEEVVN